MATARGACGCSLRYTWRHRRAASPERCKASSRLSAASRCLRLRHLRLRLLHLRRRRRAIRAAALPLPAASPAAVSGEGQAGPGSPAVDGDQLLHPLHPSHRGRAASGRLPTTRSSARAFAAARSPRWPRWPRPPRLLAPACVPTAGAARSGAPARPRARSCRARSFLPPPLLPPLLKPLDVPVGVT